MREPERDTLCPIIEKDAGRHQTKVASHTATPPGGCEMAGMRCNKKTACL